MNTPKEHQDNLGRLIADLYRQAHRYFEHHLAHLGLGSGTLPVLIRLLHHDGLNQQELSERLQVDKATITRMIAKLCTLGYVRREKDANDNRAYRVFTTPKAQEIAPEIRRILHSWPDILTENFTPEEKEAALHMLQRMKDNARRYRQQHAEGKE